MLKDCEYGESFAELDTSHQGLIEAVEKATEAMELLEELQERLGGLASAAGEWNPRTYDVIKALANSAREAHEALGKSWAWGDDTVQELLDIQHKEEMAEMRSEARA